MFTAPAFGFVVRTGKPLYRRRSEGERNETIPVPVERDAAAVLGKSKRSHRSRSRLRHDTRALVAVRRAPSADDVRVRTGCTGRACSPTSASTRVTGHVIPSSCYNVYCDIHRARRGKTPKIGLSSTLLFLPTNVFETVKINRRTSYPRVVL